MLKNISLWVLLVAGAFVTEFSFANTKHSDYRNSYKIIDKNLNLTKASYSDADILGLIQDNSQLLGINEFSGQLKLEKVVKSLRAKHYHYQQELEGKKVRFGEVIVSVDDNGQVTRIFNNYYPMGKENPLNKRAPTLSQDASFDIAWNNLRVHGKLNSEPKNDEMMIVDSKGRWHLAHVVYLEVEEPRGAWEQIVDAQSGEVLTVENKQIMRKSTESTPNFRAFKGKVLDREQAFRDFFLQKESQRLTRAITEIRDGEAKVFDPDPATTLQDASLRDSSPASAFQNAYRTRVLKDLQFANGTYQLNGPWVHITNFESPSTAPTTSSNGKWDFERGNNGFNDAMTYFHVDQSQRYMQSLGFKGSNGIQEVSIGVDTDAVNGDDNSYFNPGSNVLAFGHGCVDDNEDADVILHEYGHAINASINSSWSGGDTGAMGEGFGDYWAASYSHSTENGDAFQVNKVFTWDGIDECWGGRVLNATNIFYNESRTYGAHQGIENGHQSDELWSSPLFQAFLELRDLGVAREEIDTIVLESQFGLGAGLTMRDWAKEIIVTAQDMFPNGPHASVFRKHFEDYHIVEAPSSDIVVSEFELIDSAGNGVVEPGETVSAKLILKNEGDLKAENIRIFLSVMNRTATPSISEFNIRSLEAGETVDLSQGLFFEINSNINCGEKIAVQTTTQYDGLAAAINTDYEFGTGEPDGIVQSSSELLAIPDNDFNGINSTLDIEDDFLITSEFNIDLEITHTYIGDLQVVLTSPTGVSVKLHDFDGGSEDDIIGNYPRSLTPSESLAPFIGTQAKGSWTLHIQDNAGDDVGELVGWGLNDVQGYICQ